MTPVPTPRQKRLYQPSAPQPASAALQLRAGARRNTPHLSRGSANPGQLDLAEPRCCRAIRTYLSTIQSHAHCTLAANSNDDFRLAVQKKRAFHQRLVEFQG